MKGKNNVGLVLVLEIIILFVGLFSTWQLSVGLNEGGSFLTLVFAGALGFFQAGSCMVISVLVIPSCSIFLSKTKTMEIGKRFHAVRFLSLIGFVISLGNVVPQLIFAGYSIGEVQPDQLGVFLLFMVIFIAISALHLVVFYSSAKTIKAAKESERS